VEIVASDGVDVAMATLNPASMTFGTGTFSNPPWFVERLAELMRERGINVGGEQSGHMILSDFATTGDGLVAALQVLAVIVEQARPASEVCRVFTPLPQRLRSVRFAGISPLRHTRVHAARGAAERLLGGSGRLLVRESGTEPVVRVMAEGEDETLVQRVVDDLCETIAEIARMREDAA
jgi:phosphoglucosamine mutase